MATEHTQRLRPQTWRQNLGSTAAVVIAASILTVTGFGLLALGERGDGRDGVQVDDGRNGRDGWEQEATVPELRSGAVMVVASGGDIMLWGGLTHAAGARAPDSEFYDRPDYPPFTGKRSVDGVVFDRSTGDWEPIPNAPVPFLGFEVSAAWTGSELLVWGVEYDSLGPGTTRSVGARFDPVRQVWRAMVAQDHVALGIGVWTGEEFVVVGRGGSVVRAAAYDPARDAWRLLDDPPLLDTPSPPFGALVWTGAELLIAGDAIVVGDPASGDWRATSASPFAGRRGSRFVWSGSELLQIGGGIPEGDILVNDGGGAAYDPSRDSWQVLAGVPSELGSAARYRDGAIFLGERAWHYSSSSHSWRRLVDHLADAVAATASTNSDLWVLTREMSQPGEKLVPLRLLRYGR